MCFRWSKIQSNMKVLIPLQSKCRPGAAWWMTVILAFITICDATSAQNETDLNDQHRHNDLVVEPPYTGDITVHHQKSPHHPHLSQHGREYPQCERITATVCQGLGYNMTAMPNLIGHQNLIEAEIMVNYTQRVLIVYVIDRNPNERS